MPRNLRESIESADRQKSEELRRYLENKPRELTSEEILDRRTKKLEKLNKIAHKHFDKYLIPIFDDVIGAKGLSREDLKIEQLKLSQVNVVYSNEPTEGSVTGTLTWNHKTYNEGSSWSYLQLGVNNHGYLSDGFAHWPPLNVQNEDDLSAFIDSVAKLIIEKDGKQGHIYTGSGSEERGGWS